MAASSCHVTGFDRSSYGSTCFHLPPRGFVQNIPRNTYTGRSQEMNHGSDHSFRDFSRRCATFSSCPQRTSPGPICLPQAGWHLDRQCSRRRDLSVSSQSRQPSSTDIRQSTTLST